MKKTKTLIVAALMLAAVLLLTGCAGKIRFLLAEKLFGEERCEEAMKIYETIPDYEGAAGRIDECSAAISYDEATAYMEAGDFVAAADAFGLCGNYLDAKAKKAECEKETAYAVALEAYEAGDYSAAASAFAALSGFKDADRLLDECALHMPVRLVAHEDISPETIESVFGTFTLVQTYTGAAGLGAITSVGVSELADDYISIAIRIIAAEDYAEGTDMYKLITGSYVTVDGANYNVGVVMTYGTAEHYAELFFGIPASSAEHALTLSYTASDGTLQTLDVDQAFVLNSEEYAVQVVQPFVGN